MKIRKQTVTNGEKGQAATECIIVSVFLLIPLFLIIPLLGKYIDIKHAAINQARFEAWEYTVWNGPQQRVMNDIRDDQSAGPRPYAETRENGKKFFFSDPTDNTYGTPQMVFHENPLWVDHRGNSLFVLPTEIMSGDIKENKTPDGLGGILDFIFNIFKFVTTTFGDILKFVHVDAKFDTVYTKGYYTSSVAIDVHSLDDILPMYSLSGVTEEKATSPLHITAKASVLAAPGNSGSTENTTAETRGLVFTALLKPVSDTVNGVVSGINDLVSHIPLLEIQLPSMPDFGYVKDDLIPYEHLEDNQKQLREKSGLYYYE